MVTELEEQFFKVLGIEPKRNCYWSNTHCKDCNEDCVNFYIKPKYPEITDRKLLEMICLVADIHNCSGDVFDIEQNDINELKNFILYYLINYMKTEHTDTFYKNDEVKICVQQLFKEEI